MNHSLIFFKYKEKRHKTHLRKCCSKSPHFFCLSLFPLELSGDNSRPQATSPQPLSQAPTTSYLEYNPYWRYWWVPGTLPVRTVRLCWSEQNLCTVKRLSGSIPTHVGLPFPHPSQSWRRSPWVLFLFLFFERDIFPLETQHWLRQPINFA